MALTKISEQLVTGVSGVNFTAGIDSTYKLSKIEYINVNPDASSGSTYLEFQVNESGGSGWNEQVVGTFFKSQHYVGGTANLSYDSGVDTQGTTFIKIFQGPGPGATENVSGELYLFNPSNTTYVKHWWTINNGIYGPYAARGTTNPFVAGYFDTTAAIDEVRFKMSDDGNFDGYFSLWGL